jgi:His/Glu/Gln/Arg/opine family amino acid ABC transporter permease subunit
MISAELIRSWLPDLALGASQTIEMAVLAYVLGAVIGLTIALAEGAGSSWLYRACRIYIEFIRGTPTLTQLFLIYFGLASLNVVVPGFQAAVIALGLHYAAYMAEVYRSGIAAIDRGQSEAAAALGLRRTQAMRLVVLPQAIRIILPPMTNFAISLLKDTSVASLIAAPELMMHATDITSEYYMPMPVYLITGAIYFIMAYPLSLLVAYFERRTGQSRLRSDLV